MPFTLVCGKKKLRLDKPVVIGRNYFPDRPLLSRKHFEVRADDDGRILVTDLGSANGTSLKGNRLPANVPIEFNSDDELTAGGLTFSVKPVTVTVIPFKTKFLIAVAVFFGCVFCLLLAPSMAFGRAIGYQGLLLIIAALGFPVLASTWFFSRISKNRAWSTPRYAFAVLIATMVLNDGIVEMIDATTDLNRSLAVHKIQYFCLSHFSADQCVTQINSCPSCAGYIGDTFRQQIADRLRVFLPATD